VSIILWVIFQLTGNGCSLVKGGSLIPSAPTSSIVEQARGLPDYDKLLSAIAKVESGGNSKAYNAKENAAGLYQIRPIYLKDVNRFSKEQFTLADRFDPAKARRIVIAYLEHYCKGKSFEYMARCHNGGATGYQKQSTIAYWQKVKAYLWLI
jgi:hypothetical protein